MIIANDVKTLHKKTENISGPCLYLCVVCVRFLADHYSYSVVRLFFTAEATAVPVILQVLCHKVLSSLPVLQCFAQVRKGTSWWTHMSCGRGWVCTIVCQCAALQTDKCDWYRIFESSCSTNGWCGDSLCISLAPLHTHNRQIKEEGTAKHTRGQCPSSVMTCAPHQ